jgi:hypothetical protein
MKARADCIPCLLTMTLSVARKVAGDEEEAERFLRREVLASGLVSEASFERFTPEIVRDVWMRLTELYGDDDPLREERHRQNEVALAALPEVRTYVARSSDPLLYAVKLSIAGNMLDAMLQVDGLPPAEMVEQVEREIIAEGTMNDFRRRLARATNVVWLTDNCGEIVFDRLAIETVKAIYPVRVNVVTRTLPVVNDAVREDALEVGLGEVADAVLENGILEPLPSTDVAKMSGEAAHALKEADLIVSKGVGNYELLSEERSLRGRITFLVHGKCLPMCREGGVEKGGLVVYNY